MMRFIRRGFEVVQVVAMVAAVAFIFVLFLKIIEPLAPVVTALAVLLFTLRTFDGWMTATLSVGGLALYAASWPAVSTWGVLPGMLIWSMGVLLWFSAVYIAFEIPTRKITA